MPGKGKGRKTAKWGWGDHKKYLTALIQSLGKQDGYKAKLDESIRDFNDVCCRIKLQLNLMIRCTFFNPRGVLAHLSPRMHLGPILWFELPTTLSSSQRVSWERQLDTFQRLVQIINCKFSKTAKAVFVQDVVQFKINLHDSREWNITSE